MKNNKEDGYIFYAVSRNGGCSCLLFLFIIGLVVFGIAVVHSAPDSGFAKIFIDLWNDVKAFAIIAIFVVVISVAGIIVTVYKNKKK